MTANNPPKPRPASRLNREDSHLWSLIAATVVPMRGRSAPAERRAGAKDEMSGRSRSTHSRSSLPVIIDKPKKSLPRSSDPRIPNTSKVHQKRETLHFDATVDLHGLSQTKAHERLQFVLTEVYSVGGRSVLVITGKGNLSLEGDLMTGNMRGVLRRVVPGWLEAAPLRNIVSGCEEAPRAYGGQGALWVRLKRHTPNY